MINIFDEKVKLKEVAEDNAKPSIVLIDDDVAFSAMLSEFLRSEMNMKTDMYLNGRHFLEDYKATDTRIIILDYDFSNVDGPDGLTVLKEIKKVNPFALVIMVSGQDNVEIAVETLRVGASDYFYKLNKTVFPNILSSIIKLLEIEKKRLN
ncbi:MAG: response regulator [Bacteroidetes bacterium]|nr:response regulator [Bacteroidota bacterium]